MDGQQCWRAGLGCAGSEIDLHNKVRSCLSPPSLRGSAALREPLIKLFTTSDGLGNTMPLSHAPLSTAHLPRLPFKEAKESSLSLTRHHLGCVIDLFLKNQDEKDKIEERGAGLFKKKETKTC